MSSTLERRAHVHTRLVVSFAAQYVPDIVRRPDRSMIVGQTKSQSYNVGKSSVVKCEVENVDFSDFKRHELLNVGTLVLVFVPAEREAFDALSIVMQVYEPDEVDSIDSNKRSDLRRRIFNPFEEAFGGNGSEDKQALGGSKELVSEIQGVKVPALKLPRI